jgi:hypothetical protein
MLERLSISLYDDNYKLIGLRENKLSADNQQERLNLFLESSETICQNYNLKL